MTKERPTDDGAEGRFTEHPHVTREEAGPVKDKDGKELWAGDPGFMEAMAEEMGFDFIDLT